MQVPCQRKLQAVNYLPVCDSESIDWEDGYGGTHLQSGHTSLEMHGKYTHTLTFNAHTHTVTHTQNLPYLTVKYIYSKSLFLHLS